MTATGVITTTGIVIITAAERLPNYGKDRALSSRMKRGSGRSDYRLLNASDFHRQSFNYLTVVNNLMVPSAVTVDIDFTKRKFHLDELCERVQCATDDVALKEALDALTEYLTKTQVARKQTPKQAKDAKKSA